MSFSLNSTISEFTADQAPFENENLTPFEALRRVRMTELERLQKMNSEKGNEENGNKMKKAKADPLADRMKLLLSTAKFADAHFLVGQNDKKELVLAHRAILSASSDVFEAMFQKEVTENANGKIVEKVGAVLLPDVDVEAFKVMLRFIYSDDLSELNGQNAAEVLYAALKFNVIGLVKALADFPIPKLTNVFAALCFARFNDLLKDFVQHCFEYIDRNTDDLFKSEKFLQIDQNLLCDIFGRDELQISGEIPIWKAVNLIIYKKNLLCFLALRWSDSKCRQNGIECLAQNRRAMLGPALFKIRFPLLSNDAFSKIIVPSDVLSKDEVIAVYQFQALPNRRGISEGIFPMPFPTNGRISDWKKGTLLMDIEKVSEFAREKVESSRYSEKVYINGFMWKIWARIEMKNGSTDNNEKWLGIFLLCDAPAEEDSNWNCKCSATFRILSQKNWVENSTGTLCDGVLDNESNNIGFVNFISFVKLMDPINGFYNKEEGKVTLVIDVILKDEKTEKSISDQNKSNGTISMEIENLSEFAREAIWSERKSETVHIKGIPWRILAEIEMKDESTDNDQKWLGFSLLCDAPKEDENWSCKCSATFRIISQKNGTANSIGTLNDHVLDNESNNIGFVNFISFVELMDPINGFYNQNEDKVTLAIDVKVKDEKMEEFVSDPNKSNGTILMEIEKVSEFAREIFESERKSETVHIKGFQWKIWAQNDKDENTDNELNIFLLCGAPKEDKHWNCKCSGNVRIVSQKNGLLGFKKVFVDLVFDNENSWKCVKFISFAELMDPSKGLYDKKEDKVTLAIDVTVKVEKMEKFVSDPNKSNGTISMEIEKMSEFAREILGSERESETVHINGFPWKLCAKNDKDEKNDNKLYIFLLCDFPEEDKHWNCKCSGNVRIVSQKNGVLDEFVDLVFDNEHSWKCVAIISFAELMDPSKGLYDKKEDKVTLAIDVTLVPAHKGILKFASDVFEAMFRFEANKEQGENVSANCPTNVEIPDVEAAAFKVMLSFIYTEDLSELNGDNTMAVLYAVPSGVLTADEVIGVKKYHNNPNVISEGILYPLPFPSRERIRTFGTLFMDIEKVSQFALEAFGSSRYSEKLYINKMTLAIDVTTVDGPKKDKLILDQNKSNGTISMEIEKVSEFAREAICSERKSKTVHSSGLPWEIVAQINHRKEGTDNEKCLSIFLLCSAYNDENWSCKCFGTFRVVSQKSDMADYRKEFNDQLLNNRTPSRGYANVISFAELMDPSKGFYNKSKDKVTLAIDFTVEEAKTEENDNQF
ncbi:hypothetical protein niasHS_008319 [Heterodera schachtii]|uniref:BTB domain-containing protein n=1 Tax=Heterodera schachtii TaxID=97005 RepID=A0ABD2JAJ7_HETSC